MREGKRKGSGAVRVGCCVVCGGSLGEAVRRSALRQLCRSGSKDGETKRKASFMGDDEYTNTRPSYTCSVISDSRSSGRAQIAI